MPSTRGNRIQLFMTSLPCRGIRIEHAAADLVELDRLEECAEIALAEALVTFALDDLEENRADHGIREDLQQQAAAPSGRAVDQDPVAAEPIEILAMAGEPRIQLLVVGVGHVHER